MKRDPMKYLSLLSLLLLLNWDHFMLGTIRRNCKKTIRTNNQ